MKQKTALWLLAIFFVALNLRPVITSIGPLFTVLLEDLESTNTKISLLTSIPVFCMGLFAPFALPLTKRMPTMIMPLLLALISVSTLVRMVTTAYSVLFFTSFLAGFAIAIIGPIMNVRIQAKFKERTASALGVYSFGIGVGATLSASFSYVIYQYTSVNFALGVWGIAGIIALMLWLFVAKDEVVVSEQHEQVGRNPWQQKEAWLILVFFGLQTALFFSFMTWLSPLAVAKGFSQQEAGYLLMAFSGIQMIGNLVIPWLVERFAKPIHWLFGLSVFTLLGVLVVALTYGIALWLGVLVIGLTLSGLFPLGLLLPLTAARNHTEATTWSSMVLSGGFMLSALLPFIIGMVIDQTANERFAYPIFTAIIILMLGVITWLAHVQKQVK